MVSCDDYFDDLIKQRVSPCFSIMAWKNDKTIYQYTKGHVTFSPEDQRVVTAKTQFNVGSVTKTITGALIIKLVEMGLVTLNESVKHYIKEYKFEKVTLHHLLTHTAGYHKDPSFSWPQKPTLNVYLQQIYDWEHCTQPQTALGENVNYFTFGYSILMDVIERVTGMTIEQFAKKVLFDPLDMKDTTYDTDLLDETRYILPNNLKNERQMLMFDRLAPTGDSGLYSTAGDLIKFGAMFLYKGTVDGKRIFAESSIDLMLREVTGGKFNKTPIFWMKAQHDVFNCFGDLNSPSTVGHPGFSGCMLFIDPVYHTAGAIVTNSQNMHTEWRHYRAISNLLMSEL